MKPSTLKQITIYLLTLCSLVFLASCSSDSADEKGGDEGVKSTPKIGDIKVVDGTLADNGVQIAIPLTDDGGELDLCGVCWDTEQNPSVDNLTKKNATDPKVGTINIAITDLLPQTTYYARAYARNSLGLIYSKQISFTTLEQNTEGMTVPVLGATTLVGEAGTTSISVKSTITSDGGGALTESGFCWGAASAPTTADSKKAQTTINTGDITEQITSLSPNTTYYVRSYAVNAKGTAYGTELTVKTATAPQTLKGNAGSTFLVGASPEAPKGVNTTTDALVDTEYNAVQIAAYPLVWNGWTSRSTHNIDGLKGWATWAKANNKTTIGHFLTSHNTYYPQWLIDEATPMTAVQLEALLEERIKAVVQPLADKIDIWTVVNEACILANKKGSYKPCIWTAMGTEPDESGCGFTNTELDIPVYIRKSLELTRKYAPNAKLILCDAKFELSLLTDLRSRAFEQLVKHLKAKGTPLDGIAMQTHITFGKAGFEDPANTPRWDLLAQHIKMFKDLGLKVYLNEVDMSMTFTEGTVLTTEQLNYQKLAYKTFMKTILGTNDAVNTKLGLNEGTVSSIKADGVVFWGLGEGHDASFRPYDCAQLYDYNHQKKPAYHGVLEALQEAQLK